MNQENRMKVDTDPDAVSKAIMDAITYGTGIVKIAMHQGGSITCDHVPVTEYEELAVGLNWVASQSKETPQ